MNINDFYNSKSYRIYKTRKGFNLVFSRLIRTILYIIGCLSFLLIADYYLKIFSISENIIGFSSIALAMILTLLFFDIFINYGYRLIRKTSLSEIKDPDKLFNYFSQDVVELFEKSFQLTGNHELDGLRLPCLVFALQKTQKGRYFLNRSQIIMSNQLVQDGVKKIINQDISDLIIEKQINKLLVESQKHALEKNRSEIGIAEVILALFDGSLFFSHLAFELGLKRPDIINITNWTDRLFAEFEKKYYWQKDYYKGGIGKDWASGFTPALNLFSYNISEYLLDARLEYQSAGHRLIIKDMENTLAKSGKNNLLLIGDSGVGKRTIVNSLAQKMTRGQVYKTLRYKHIIQLDTVKILAGANQRGDIEARFANIFNEVIKAGNIILYIDNIASLVGGGAGEVGSIDATEFLIPYLQSEKVQVIATVSWEDFKNKVQIHSGFENLFSKIEVKEPARNEVLPILEDALLYVEAKHGVVFTYQSVRELVEMSDRYIHDQPFPQKAIDLLGELGIRAEKENNSIITSKDVDDLISEKIKIPVGEAKTSEKEKLLHLEEYLHQRVIGQDEAISAIANALRRARAGLSGKNKPIGSFLFIGPTGVGKTETAKALAEAYYGKEENMIRFDMSEFQEVNTISRLIGSKTAGRFAPGRLTQSVKNNPYTLLLLDEIEKANPNILNLLLQVLDEGNLTDASGRKIDFTNAIIICTSNAGAEKIREYIQKNLSGEELGKIIVDYLLKQGTFKPEFLNRFDKTVCYKPLTIKQLFIVVKLMLRNLNKTMAQKDIKLDISQKAIEEIVRAGYDPAFGARPMRRMISEKVENLLAKKMLSGELKKGATITLTEKDI